MLFRFFFCLLSSVFCLICRFVFFLSYLFYLSYLSFIFSFILPSSQPSHSFLSSRLLPWVLLRGSPCVYIRIYFTSMRPGSICACVCVVKVFRNLFFPLGVLGCHNFGHFGGTSSCEHMILGVRQYKKRSAWPTRVSPTIDTGL